MVAILALAGGYAYYAKVFSKSSTSSGSQAQTALVRRGDLVVSASGSGTLIANSDASFGFAASGQVTDVYVKVGDQVEAGQVLAQLDTTLLQMKYEEAQQNLRELYSAASIATIQQEIATAQDTEASARDWLAYLISPDVVEAEDNLATAQQKLTEAQAAAKATPSDAANQAVLKAQQAVDYLNDKLNQAWTYYQNVYLLEKFGVYENVGSRRHPKQVLVMTTDPITGEEVPETEGASTADLAAARNNYAQAKETISQGQDNTQLIAPISGTVTALDLRVGEQAGTSSVITISQLSQPYTVDTYLDEADWSMAQVGNKVNVTFDLLPEQTYSGTVTLVYPELNPSFEASLVHLVVQLEKSISQDLPTGTAATVDVVGGEATGVLLVPVGAIHKNEQNKSAVTVLQNGQQVEREIEIGLQNDTYAEVKSGLEAGDVVVTK